MKLTRHVNREICPPTALMCMESNLTQCASLWILWRAHFLCRKKMFRNKIMIWLQINFCFHLHVAHFSFKIIHRDLLLKSKLTFRCCGWLVIARRFGHGGGWHTYGISGLVVIFQPNQSRQTENVIGRCKTGRTERRQQRWTFNFHGKLTSTMTQKF